jgi:DNA polymerase-3 subunit gamma/tau
VFGVVDKVIETGQDPRRFTEDLLRRLRDLVIVSAVPDAPATGLIDIAEDAAERLVSQAARFGPAELSRAADLVASGLTEMRGATAPRLLLELICARVLLPGADHTTEGVQARLDRLERRLTIAGGEPPAAVRAPVADPPLRVAPQTPAAEEPTSRPAPEGTSEPAAEAPPEPAAAPPSPESSAPELATTAPAAAPASEPVPEPAVAETAAGSPLSLVDVRRLWPDIVEATKQRRRVTWIHLTQHAQVVAVDAQVLTLGFGNVGARESFDNGGSSEIVRQAAIDVVGHDWRVETIVDPGADPEAAAPPPAPAARPAAPAPAPPAEPPPFAQPAPAAGSPSTTARQAIAPTRSGGRDEPETAGDSDGGARADDADAESSGLDGAELLQQALGAQVIEEIPHQ